MKETMRHKKCLKTSFLTVGFVTFFGFYILLFMPLYYPGSFCADANITSRCDCMASLSTNFNERNHYTLVNKLKQIPEEKCLMSIKPTGRLGNLMGEYATLYALSRLNGRPAYIDETMYKGLSEYFNLSLPVLDDKLTQRLPWTIHKINDWMEDNYTNFNGHFVRLDGYPCSWTFYHHMRKEILQEFTFHADIIRDVNNYLAKVKGTRTSVTYVGIHIRRGDYVELMPSYYDGVLADAKFFRDAMGRFRSRFPDALFIVCSDDLKWARENIVPVSNDVVFGWMGVSSTPGRDMALLSRCNHTIITFGTFGYWSAYLAGGKTVYLSNFTRPGSKYLEVFHFDTGYLPEWEGVSVGNLPPRSSKAILSMSTVPVLALIVTLLLVSVNS